MAFAYSIRDQQGIYFITFTVHQWVDVFTRKEYKDLLLDSISYCQKHKGLMVYAWVIMSNHCHLIAGSDKEPLSNIIRDLKSLLLKALLLPLKSMKRKAGKDGFYGY
jgi:REP element-mobilizing transposase RayT